ncbi:putative transcription factor TGA like domain-containing protein [Medicago truncatula]|uniref:Putative transcription factor TGA like domain-containing protein n=1 Tax=Medicago truncatula TaxID=3880 RepID=G7LF21_MEDTR|nr:protein DOG1-like 4 [Medicago truncatula]AET04831.1 transcription factor TGA5-like protein [Medicago truncatula]RHN43165.1 putative transcription factor TGA like domain-containing protein [Medicago truncatula]
MMSLLPSNGNDAESFNKFFECWMVEQNKYLNELVAAKSAQPQLTNDRMHTLIDKVVEHYECYYKTKSSFAKKDVLSMFSPPWLSTLEEAFLWIGGWRPSMAFHLLYSKCSMQFQARLNDLIQGQKTCDLGDLTASQLAEFDDLQKKTIREEREITDMLAEHQETVADAPMVELSHVVSEMIRGGENEKKELEERIESVLEPKVEGLEKILYRADDLRLRALQGIVNILTPKQAIHFLIAAAELHLRLHEWGKKKDDAKKGNQGIREGEIHNS